jgi:hypothetical protein
MLEDVLGTKEFLEDFFRVSGKFILSNKILILEDSFLQFLFSELVVDLLFLHYVKPELPS